MTHTTHKITGEPAARDGLDNTGTQGNDSLSDDAYKGAVIITEPSSNDPHKQTPITISSPPHKGEKIILDVLINEKLAHVIVIQNGSSFHINLDGKDKGRLELAEDGKIKRFPQPKSDSIDNDIYFDPIEEKLKALNKLG
ncbi:hypothetical protein [Pedobacter xixiisoli]|uniref:Uncharacterized protein n=1 Tax=Pedobacter xixiisoli TaxID=1476464 RepID=A0A285ZZT6_9SPHI|nr:hypothetical protein [Pedobacter xixiisoli]SOD15150.1 hypothetical protein SAMN06297358_2126 [Pedobacter xixiisoli]